MRTEFTASELAQLKAAYSSIDKVCVERITGFHKILGACDDKAISQLICANIKFVSKLAINERIRREAL